MTDESTRKALKSGLTFAEKIGAVEARKLKARRNPQQVWFGLGMMGLIGWSVTISHTARRRTWCVVGRTASGKTLVDAGVALGGPRGRLFECLALGRQRRRGHAGGAATSR